MLKHIKKYYQKLPYKKIIIPVFILFLLYLLLFTFARYIQTVSTFPGMYLHTRDIIGKIDTKLQFEEINITDSKGNNINGLFIDNNSKKTIYYFHGNGGPLPYFYSKIKYYSDLGYNVAAYDYPGYGKSTGFPYEKNVVQASELFWEYLEEKKHVEEKEIIVGAHSVGTALAIQFVQKHPNVDRLFLISPLASRYDMSVHFLGIPFQRLLFLENSFVSKDIVKYFDIPVLIIHGNGDKIVPFWQGKKVFANYKGEKNFIEIPDFGHNLIVNIYGEALKPVFYTFFSGKDLDFTDNYLIMDGAMKEQLEQESKTIDFLAHLDLETDSSLQKFVTLSKPFNDKSYVPNNLEPINSKYIYDTKGAQVLRKEAQEALQEMGKAFYKEFEIPMTSVSAYRSYLTQKGIKDRGCPDKFCAKAGHSEHQSGLAIDFFEATTEKQFLAKPKFKQYFEWMKENAHKYGFHNTYQRGIEIDGYVVEPWHWRYVGEEFATYLKDKEITIAEYYNSLKIEKK